MRRPPPTCAPARPAPRTQPMWSNSTAVARVANATPPSVLQNVLHLGMAETITFRPDEDAQRALAILTADGTTASSAVRSALIDAARTRARQQLRAEAEELATDAADRAEAAQVLRDMETLRAW
jgi:hypothetical protein